VAYAVVWAIAAAPGVYLGWQLWLAWTGQPHTLGEEPVERLEHETGTLAIRFLALTLAVTPLRQLTKWNAIARYRRTLGLFTFWYASLHLATFAALDLELDLGEVATEIVKRPYITVGFAAWCLLVPLAVTSTTGWIRRLGGRRWNVLHRATYAVAALAMVHFFWSQKKDLTDPAIYAAIFAVLLGWRIWRRYSSPDRAAVS
jgi:sulfoxide reductase heme-binding subunit YedZ